MALAEELGTRQQSLLQSNSSPGAWDDPQWTGKLLWEHRLQRSRLYRAPTRCHKQGQCCPLPHTSSRAVPAGLPDRKQPYENSREEWNQNQKSHSGSRATLATRTCKERYGPGLGITRMWGCGREWASFWKHERYQACLCAPEIIQGIPEETSSPVAWAERWGAANVYLNLVSEIHGWGREIKENTGLTAAKTKVHLHLIQHNFSCFSIALKKSWHMWIDVKR